MRALLPGLVFVGALSAVATWMASWPALTALRISPLVVGILIGVVIGNTRHENIPYIVRIREGATCDYDILIALPAVCEAERRRRRAAVPHRTVDCTVVPADAE